MQTPNAIELIRRKKEQTHTLSQEEQLVLRQGFTSGFWKLIEKQLMTQFDACQRELESALDNNRIRILQGEIAALRVLLDWSASSAPKG